MSNNTSDDAHLEAEYKTDTSHIDLPIDSIIDKKERQRLKWKLDLFVLPLISSVYFFGSMVHKSYQYHYSVLQKLIIYI